MPNKHDFPKLGYLIECYYFQTWDRTFGDAWDAPLRKAFAGESREIMLETTADITKFLAQGYSEEEIAAFAASWDIGPSFVDMKRFLTAVRDLILELAAATTDTSP